MLCTALETVTTSLGPLAKGSEQIRHSIQRLFTDGLEPDHHEGIVTSVSWDVVTGLDIPDELESCAFHLTMVFKVNYSNDYDLRHVFCQRAKVLSTGRSEREQKTPIGYLPEGWDCLSTHFNELNCHQGATIYVSSFPVKLSDLPENDRLLIERQLEWGSIYSRLEKMLLGWKPLSTEKAASFKADFIAQLESTLPEELGPEPLPFGEPRDQLCRRIIETAGAYPDEQVRTDMLRAIIQGYG